MFLSVKADQRLYIGDDEVNADTLGATLDAKTQGKKDTTIFFQADKGVDYGDLMSVMDKLRSAGYLKVGLVGLESAAKK